MSIGISLEKFAHMLVPGRYKCPGTYCTTTNIYDTQNSSLINKCLLLNIGGKFRSMSNFYDETFLQNLKTTFNPFSTNVPLLYLLKTSENFQFSDVFRGYRSGTLVENGLKTINCFRKKVHCRCLTRFWVGSEMPKSVIKCSHFISLENTRKLKIFWCF